MVSKSSNEDLAVENIENPPIHGDVLESILSHLSLIDLVPASHVSKGWNGAVFSYLRHLNTPKPWLIAHTQTTRSNAPSAMRAYDPRCDTWIKIESQPSIKLHTVVKSSSPNLLYALSPSKLSFSLDPLHLTWHHADPPKVWRVDPVVVVIGRNIIVAGGSCDFEEDPLVVEMYDQDSAKWTTCVPMPPVFEGSSSSTWLSAATDGYSLFVMEKQSGVMHTFDPKTKVWSGPLDLRPDPDIYYSEIAFVNGDLIVIGLIGDSDNVKGLKIWKVEYESFEELCEMPNEILEKLKEEDSPLSSIGACSAGNFLYIYSNCFTAEEVVACELVDGGCRWKSIENVAAGERTVFTCSEIGFGDAQNVLRSEKLRITRLRGF